MQSRTRTCQEGFLFVYGHNRPHRPHSSGVSSTTRPAPEHHDGGFSHKRHDCQDNRKISCTGRFGSLEEPSLIADATPTHAPSTLIESRRFLIGRKILWTNTVTLMQSKEYPCHLVVIVVSILRIHPDVSDLGTWHFRGQYRSCATSLSSRSIPLEVRARFKNQVDLEACKRRILIYCASAKLPHYSNLLLLL